MKNPSKANLPAKLARGRERFEKWRSTHKPRVISDNHSYLPATIKSSG